MQSCSYRSPIDGTDQGGKDGAGIKPALHRHREPWMPGDPRSFGKNCNGLRVIDDGAVIFLCQTHPLEAGATALAAATPGGS